MSSVDEILAGYANLRPGQEDFYRDLHRRDDRRRSRWLRRWLT
jgi:hypothetical protein